MSECIRNVSASMFRCIDKALLFDANVQLLLMYQKRETCKKVASVGPIAMICSLKCFEIDLYVGN